jgi:hypothetical protein
MHVSVAMLPAKTAYLDGELCALRPDGVPAFSRLQAAMDERCIGRRKVHTVIWRQHNSLGAHHYLRRPIAVAKCHPLNAPYGRHRSVPSCSFLGCHNVKAIT